MTRSFLPWLSASLVFGLVACGGAVTGTGAPGDGDATPADPGGGSGAGASGASGGSASGAAAGGASTGIRGHVELVAGDRLRCSYDFVRAAYGTVEQNGTYYNAGQHLDYGFYDPGFTVAIQGGDLGDIIDLGADAEVAAALGVAETAAGGAGFEALSLDGARAGARFNLPAAQRLADETPTDWNVSTPALPDHVYALRIVDDEPGASEDLVVKLHVVALSPGATVDLDWQRLR